MTRSGIACGVALALWLGTPAAAFAQESSFTYDPSAEITVSGTVLAVAAFPVADGGVGVHLDLKTPDGTLNVHVAPALFVGQANFWFFADDQIEIVGARASIDGNSAFIARAVKKDGKTLALRAPDGRPMWKPAAEGADGCGVDHAPLPRGTER